MKAPLRFSCAVTAALRVAAPVPGLAGGSIPPAQAPTDLPIYCEGNKRHSKVKSTHGLDLKDCTGRQTAVKQTTQFVVKNSFAKGSLALNRFSGD